MAYNSQSEFPGGIRYLSGGAATYNMFGPSASAGYQQNKVKIASLLLSCDAAGDVTVKDDSGAVTKFITRVGADTVHKLGPFRTEDGLSITHAIAGTLYMTAIFYEA